MAKAREPIRLLFVCMGNICRSPLAEGVFRHHAEAAGATARFDIDSAGTGGWHAGERADHRMRAVAKRHGVSLDSRARKVRAGDVDRFDLILCMDEANHEDMLGLGAPDEKVHLLLDCDPATEAREVPDPYYGGVDGFDLVYRLVDAACASLLSSLLDGREVVRGGSRPS